mmetsp:Transcript_66229/g.204929  ORF Transcript_66229/g.204929 Transcript_66229/m.204929 type:complete len:202 (-) Transcript_66229:88-693(-)
MSRDVRPRSTTLSFGSAGHSMRREHCRQSRHLGDPSASESPLSGGTLGDGPTFATSPARSRASSGSKSLPLLLRSSRSPLPAAWLGPNGGELGTTGLVGVALAESSPEARRSMFCFARFRRFIISSAASFFAGSVSLSGWYCRDFARQALVISLAVAVTCTPRMTWSGSSQIVFTRAGSVLNPFCALSMLWLSEKTRTQAT